MTSEHLLLCTAWLALGLQASSCADIDHLVPAPVHILRVHTVSKSAIPGCQDMDWQMFWTPKGSSTRGLSR